MLKIQQTNHSAPPFWLMEKSITIGTDKSNNIVINDHNAEATHAKIIRQSDGVILRDMRTNSGTHVNGRKITQKQLFFGDKFVVGDTEFEVLDPTDKNRPNATHTWSLIADSSWLSGQEFPLLPTSGGNTLIVGRGKQCDLVFPGTHLSREHAKVIFHNNNSITLTDLNSSNGTYVNDAKILGETTVVAGDRVRLDVYSFRLFGPGLDFSKMIKTSTSQAHIKSIENAETLRNKKWKTKPTSIGNREELSHYNSSYTWLYAAIIFTIFVSLIIYFLNP